MRRFLSTRLATLFLLAVVTASLLAQTAAPAPAPPLNPQDVIPFDAAVDTARLPNGLTYFVRQNSRPAKRVSLRLVVKAGSIDETDDQRGLAHFVEHMAFNGSAHFKPGEVFSYFESVGARLGPHVNAYTSFDETVYMLDLPSDRPDVVEKGLTALADFAGGLSFIPAEVDKERGVVIEEWRGGLGAASRIRDKQIPVLYQGSRYAERLPIGKPEIIRTAPPERLRAFYDTWYRPERMAVIAVGDIDAKQIEKEIAAAFGPVRDRAPAQPDPDRSVPLTPGVLVSVAADPEVTQSSVSILRKAPQPDEVRVADYRRDLVERLVEHMMDERFGEIAQRNDAKFLAASAGSTPLSRDVSAFALSAGVPDGGIEDGLSAVAVEAKRVEQYGFGAAEIDRAKRWMSAFYEEAYSERDKTESGSFASEYIRHFLVDEPSPGIAYEYRLVRQVAPEITAAEVGAAATRLLGSSSRVVLAVSPEKAGVPLPTDADLRAALDAARQATVTAWNDTTSTRGLMDAKPAPAAVTARRELKDLGVTIVTFANGVEAWLKPTDFKNDQVLFTMDAPGGASLAEPKDYLDATLAPAFVELAGVGGIRAVDLEKLLAGKIASASPYVSLSTDGISGSAAPAELETALQLLHQTFAAPNDDPDAFALLKRQLHAMVVNRQQSPAVVFGQRVALVNSSNHYTAQPVTAERVDALDRSTMSAFYRQRFSNATDFTFFMVGAFQIDEAVPLLARYVGTLPSTGHAASRFRDVGIHFPDRPVEERVEKGREPRSQTVMSFFADPPPDPAELERIDAASTVLEIALRDELREQLGQTYGVSVGLSERLPQRGDGHMEVRFGAAPENIEGMIARTLDRIRKLQQEGPSADLTNRAREAALRSNETALRQNGYWLRRLSAAHILGTDPEAILQRATRIEAITPAVLQDVFKRYFPMDRRTVVTLMPAR
ncbi:MAG: M16 family metallopeptidase [Betaproteobacteria bacterium]